MSEKKVELGVKLNTESALTKFKAFGKGMKSTFSEINRYADATARHFGAISTALTALSTGVVLKKLFSVSDFAKIDDSMTRTQANVKMTAAEFKKFREDLADLVGKEGMDMTETFAQAKKLSLAYKPDGILKILAASDMVSDAMEVSVADATSAIVRLMKIYGQAPEDAKEIAEAIITSRADLESLGIILQRGILKGGASKDYKDVLAIVGALKSLGGDSSRVVVTIETMLNAIERKSSTLKKAGIDVFKIDPNTRQKVKKNIIELLEELAPKIEKFRKAVGDEKLQKNLDEVFGPGAGEALPFLIKNLDKVREARAKQENAAAIAGGRVGAVDETWGKSFDRIKSSVATIKEDVSFIYDLIKRPVKWFADSPTATKAAAWGTAGLALGVGGFVLASKGKAVLSDIKSSAAGAVKGKAIEAATGITPVFVTNWPGAFGTGAAPGSPNAPDGKGNKLGKGIAALGQATVVGAVGFELGSLLNQGIGWISGQDSGGKYGGEGWLGKRLFDLLNPDKARLLEEGARVDNKIRLVVNVDQNGRSTATVDGKNTDLEVDAFRRGVFAD